MNEQIRQFAEQAGLEFDDDLVLESEPIYYTSQKDLEKFAELIVKECIFAVEDAGGIEKYYHTKAIREHFGVEE